MYKSVGHAVWAMVRWREIRRGARGIFIPDDPGGPPAGEDPEADALTVDILFTRYDRRRALTRIFIERQDIEAFRAGRERRRALNAKRRFIRELCRRNLLESPLKRCFENVHLQNRQKCSNPRPDCPICPRDNFSLTSGLGKPHTVGDPAVLPSREPG